MKHQSNSPQKVFKSVRRSIVSATAENTTSGSFRQHKKFERSSSKTNKELSKSSDRISEKSMYEKINYQKNSYSLLFSKQKEIKQKQKNSTSRKERNLLSSTQKEISFLQEKNKTLELEYKLTTEEKDRKLHEQSQVIQKLKVKVFETEERLKEVQKQMEEKKDEIKLLRGQKQRKQQKIPQLHNPENEEYLNKPNDKLSKLKFSIKENQMDDLKKENESLTKKLRQVLPKIYFFENQVAKKQAKIRNLERQVSQHKHELEVKNKELFVKEENTEKILKEKLKEMEEDNYFLKGEVKKLQIELKHIERKKMEQFNVYSKAKNQQLTINKEKYSKLMKSFKEKQKQLLSHQKQQEKKKPLNSYPSRLRNPEKRKDTSISFELSPQ